MTRNNSQGSVVIDSSRKTMDTTFPTFVDPYTKGPLRTDSAGNLYREEGDRRQVYERVNESYKFVLDMSAEQDHYDTHYESGSPQSIDLEEIRGAWYDRCQPWYNTLMQSMGELRGKKILLVGAGRSPKEFYFRLRGADVVYTDLSLQGVLGSGADYKRAEAALMSVPGAGTDDPKVLLNEGSIQFHAVDANHLPFADQTFDIVYGCAFVHHLDDWSPFFAEVYRVLRPGGICRFWDQADSWLWSLLKRSLLRPLQIYSYWKHPRSEGDIRANLRGGFNRSNLSDHMRRAGFRELYFRRHSFFLVMGFRHIGKAVNWNRRAMKIAKPIFHCFRLVDFLTSWCHCISDNRLVLIWGFDK